ncbi:hypothetical protein JCM6882_007618 [Rhodosporidiobolus microsporus]
MDSARADAFTSFFERIAASDWDALPSFFAPGAEWNVGPASVAKDLPNEGKVDAQGVVEVLKLVRGSILAEAKGLEVHQMVQGGDSLAARCTNHGTAADGELFDLPVIFFIDFEPGTSKFKKGVEMVDSAYCLAAFARLKGTESQ